MSTTTTISENFPKVSEKQLVAEGKRYFTFFNLSITLVAITFVELVVLSLAKFVGVVWYFMHLRWDRLLLTFLFVLGLTLAGGTVAALLFLIGEEEQNAPLDLETTVIQGPAHDVA